MLIGYARTSTEHQEYGLEAQIEALEAAGCGKVFSERVSSVVRREALEKALEYIREGDRDVLVATKLDRLARSLRDLFDIIDRLGVKGAGLRILDSPIDTTTEFGELVLAIIGAFSEFERKMMLARQKDGLVAARREGKFRGRAPTALAKAGEIRRLAAAGVTKAQIARSLGIDRSSVYRVLARREPLPDLSFWPSLKGDSPAK